MIFLLSRFWTYSPLGWCCAVVWNCAELLDVRAPFAPFLFDQIMGIKGKRISPHS